jgi:tyrosine-protein kinase Etk/Wzc
MSDPHDARRGSPDSMSSEAGGTFRLIDLVESVARHRKALVGFTLAAAVIAAVVSLLLPPWFRSQATVLGQEEATENRRIMMTVKALALPGMRQNISSQSPETFLAILDSRTLRARIIRRFDLMKVMKVRTMDAALDVLRRRVKVDLLDTGAIKIEVEDRDRVRAAAVANGFVAELDSMNVELRIYRARRARQYLEKQLAETKGWLASVEDSLAAFQKENLLVSMDEQAKAAIDAAAELQTKAMELRIRRGVLEGYASDSNPELRAVTRELVEVEDQIHRFETGGTDGEPSIAGMPEVGLRYSRLMRNVKVGESLVTFLTQEYEDARLEEAKDTPVVQVLDRAVPADRRARPRRAMIVLTTAVIAFFLSLAFFVARDRSAVWTTDSDRLRWTLVWRSLRRWKQPPADL